MILTAQIKLLPDDLQKTQLTETLERVNAACNWLDGQAIGAGVYRQFDLQREFYRQIRTRFNLGAQATVRAISKVAKEFKRKKRRHSFSRHGAIEFDARLLSWTPDGASLWTVHGRITVPFAGGSRQHDMLECRRSSAKLCKRDGKFYLLVSCDVPAEPEHGADDVLGVDLGIVNITTDSDGEHRVGEHVNDNRRKHRRLRSELQSKGTRSARRKLKRLSGKEARFARDVNHVISSRIVNSAERTGRAIALEDLTGIRGRVRARRRQRAVLHSWSFAQLRSFVEYKAERAGVPVIIVNPRNTSRTCPSCGHCEKGNRRSQSEFRCRQCGLSAHADIVGAENIRAIGLNALRLGRPSAGLLSQALVA